MIAQRHLLSLSLLTALLASQATFAQDGWSLAKESEGIKVYVRAVEGSPLREFRGEVQIKATPDDVVKVLRDADAFRQWMPDVAASELLKATDTEQYHYLDNKAPWPVSHRDGIYHFTYAKAGDGAVTVRVEAVPDYLPRREGKVRIPQAQGQWTLVPGTDGVNVTYQMHASPGGAIPSWLANQTVVDTPYGTLKALRNHLQDAR
ncbi:START domain-containing protein [Paracidovorax anthurii]|uniref:Polyketide cyclase/dehydrase/lipid transport protein n=1 Tax=Paracidovorax anthurii TaxID=78229 RepID=A0A328ZHP4_9BURK|nr:START domain-containing protein [Paracidovorax anthurii]RAR84845.1 polyketide cyclase/dehydrase/lipid transport protein [Paracidovorax anthurii]